MKILTTILGVISALLWLWSARVSIPVGFDLDEAQGKSFQTAARLNAAAAIFSAATAIASAFSN